MLNTDHQFEVAKYRERKEDDFYLIFVEDTGQYFTVNESGHQILAMLKDGKPIDKICGYLSENDFKDIELTMHVAEYILRLKEYYVVRAAEGEDHASRKFEVPVIKSLENAFSKSEQCATFGMPKRSCKSLPSGLTSKLR